MYDRQKLEEYRCGHFEYRLDVILATKGKEILHDQFLFGVGFFTRVPLSIIQVVLDP